MLLGEGFPADAMISVTGTLDVGEGSPQEGWVGSDGRFTLEFPPIEGNEGGPFEVVVRLIDDTEGGPWTYFFTVLPWIPD